MRKLAGTSMAVLLIALPLVAPVSADVLSRDLKTYVLFGIESLRLKHGAYVNEGDLGSNGVDVGRRTDGISLGRKAYVFDGSNVVSNQCHLGSGASVDDLYTNHLTARRTGSGAVVIRGAESTFAAPILASLPPLPLFAPGGTPIDVPRGTTLSLPPGSYGAVVVPNDSELDLEGGTYEFQSLRTGKETRILVHAPSTINIESYLRVGDGSSFGPTSNLGFRQVQVTVGGSLVRVSADSQAKMDLYAPNATVRFGRSAVLVGRFVGRRITSDHSPQFNLECGNGAVDVGEQCDDGARLACDGCTPDCQLERCGDGFFCPATGEECDDGNGNSCDGCSPSCHLETCGDGITCLAQGEECDDGNVATCDGCIDCRLEGCGDGVTCAPEECDDGNTTACDGCSDCRLETCGDGVTCAPEECDDGNAVTCDGCSGCQLETCGDGVTCSAQGEACDPPAGPAACPTCTAGCQLGPRCGDGVMDTACGEQCDDGNTVSCDGCSACHLERCGDGIFCPTLGEECDDGNPTWCDGCTECELDRCGDGIACPPEQCDDSNTNACDGCTACHLDTCGDGVTCAGAGEECDPPSGPSACTTCTQTCQLGPHCGDGSVDTGCGEECDDGNATACDGCSACRTETCGDGVVCPPEECDDGNATACDGCTACRTDTCGDGVTCTNQGEECDPPGALVCSACSPTCQIGLTCGDGILLSLCGEECDDGNALACDGCTACQTDACGDGVTCAPEACDDGNAATCDGCTACQLETCGDGLVCAPEECDDGNGDPCDGCTNCRLDTCGDGVLCAPEECDDGNTDVCDGCAATCVAEFCGDGVVCASQFEECEPPDGVVCDFFCRLAAASDTFCTLSQDEWGASGGAANGPSGYVTQNPGILPVTVGAMGDLSLTVQDQPSLVCFLPTSGPEAALCTGLGGGCGGDMVINACTNPPILDPNGTFTASGGQGGGALTGEAVALKLSLAISDLAVPGVPPGLRDFVLPTIECEGICVMVNQIPTYFPIDCDIANGTRTVGDLAVMADQALRDPGAFNSPPITRSNLTQAIHSVNTAFHGCRTLCSASGAFLDTEDTGALF